MFFQDASSASKCHLPLPCYKTESTEPFGDIFKVTSMFVTKGSNSSHLGNLSCVLGCEIKPSRRHWTIAMRCPRPNPQSRLSNWLSLRFNYLPCHSSNSSQRWMLAVYHLTAAEFKREADKQTPNSTYQPGSARWQGENIWESRSKSWGVLMTSASGERPFDLIDSAPISNKEWTLCVSHISPGWYENYWYNMPAYNYWYKCAHTEQGTVHPNLRWCFPPC